MNTVLELGQVSVDVVFKDIKNVHLSVYPPTGRVRISAPNRMSLEKVRLFAISKISWIKKQQSKISSQTRETPREFLDRESHYLWGKRYLMRIFEVREPASVTCECRKLVMNVRPKTSFEKKRKLLEDWYRAELRAAAQPIVTKWERQLGLRVERYYIQKMKTKWGSSNPKRNTIRLNLELAKKHPDCLDYIILHEMAHFLVPNHGTKFLGLLDCHMPHWRTIRKTLNEAPLAHAKWGA